MNFFSHALVASRHSSDVRWVLGAMLPDFFTMARLRIKSVEDTMLQQGMDFHHASDDAFHNAPLVVELMETAAGALREQGLAKGPSAAVGHVGLELLLDGVVASSGLSMNFYRAAVSELDRIEALLHFHDEIDDRSAERWRKLARYLPTAPIPEGYAEPDFVAARLIRILANRPLLAVPTNKEKLVYSWATKTAPEIKRLATAVFTQVEERLTAIEYE